jgi:NAD(P)-dependent dehydrogenase (short-subunit alcohol dehydrogenase family)
MTDRPFEHRTVFVTGAARGIGRATAEQFLAAGANVALVDRDRQELDAVIAACREPKRALALEVDVSSARAVAAAVDTTLTTFGSLDVLVNNAAVHFARPVDGYTLEEIDLLLDINLKGALFAVRSALPALRRTKGAIVSVSSMTGLVGQSHGSVYAATKGALISMTKALALELGSDGIRVNCVCPAGVDTALMRNWAATTGDPEGVLKGQAAMHLTNRMAEPEEIAAAILFLSSPAASFITGIALPVEGGATLGYRRG